MHWFKKHYRFTIFFILFGIFLSLFGLARLYYFLTDDFHISNIRYEMAYKEEWNFPITQKDQEELQTILSQKFYYIGKGAQVYAFGSNDGKYVLKFFKFKHLKPSSFISLLPEVGPLKEFKKKNQDRKLRKLYGVFEGHRIAYNFDKKNSGLLFLHLNKTENLPLNTTLVDKLGIERDVDLNSIVFVVQKKGETLRSLFTHLFEEGKLNEAINKASQVLDMYVDEYTHRVWDRDHGITHNIGFIENTPFHLDVGKLSYDDKLLGIEFYKNDLRHVAFKMESWVKDNYPNYYAPFHTEIQKNLDQRLSRFPLSTPMPPLPSQALS